LTYPGVAGYLSKEMGINDDYRQRIVDRFGTKEIYYQVGDERKTLEGLEGKGVDLSEKERVAVDPDSPEEEEQIMMYCKQESIHMSKWEFQLLESDEEPKMQSTDTYW